MRGGEVAPPSRRPAKLFDLDGELHLGVNGTAHIHRAGAIEGDAVARAGLLLLDLEFVTGRSREDVVTGLVVIDECYRVADIDADFSRPEFLALLRNDVFAAGMDGKRKEKIWRELERTIESEFRSP